MKEPTPLDLHLEHLENFISLLIAKTDIAKEKMQDDVDNGYRKMYYTGQAKALTDVIDLFRNEVLVK